MVRAVKGGGEAAGRDREGSAREGCWGFSLVKYTSA